jgi:DNA (cytosine-5)-methyltransferase 1
MPTRGVRSSRPGAAKRRCARSGRAAHGDRFLIPYYSSGSGLTGRSIHRPVGTITTRDRWAVIEGDKMRMLAVPEARDAMSFPPSYVLPNVHRDAMHLLGNAVCPVVAADFLNELRLAA